MHSELLEVGFFAGFIILIVGLLVLDLGVFEKENKVVTMKRALINTSIWVFFAIAFGFFIRYFGYLMHGIGDMDSLKEIVLKYHGQSMWKDIAALPYNEALAAFHSKMSLEYFTGYIIEYSLSVDNIFVILLIFASFAVQKEFYKRVLMWGVLGAVVMRFIFIFVASMLVQKFEFILYIFGAFLIYTAIKMFLERNKHAEVHPEKNKLVRLASRLFPVTKTIEDQRFIKRIDGKLHLTPLLLCLIVIEFSDLLFAFDSIPAIFSVTKDPFIVFFSNIFAVLGLRSLFFLVSGVMDKFRYLKIGLSALLCFIGVKMLAEHWLHQIGFEVIHSLIIIVAILTISIVASVLIPQRKEKL
ncbi:MAG: TerC/Alx family metal homeostasis membrane protein [Bacteroidales bacterium]|jgi:tellurite resistance protein TerC|nr:TerC/Alx family metal homeostasis membrane protein [Bacteroidales bacterium]